MIKRQISITLLLLANFVLLAHGVIPHHHHESAVCIISAHCDDDSDAHSHALNAAEHQHDGQNHSVECSLKKAFTVPVNSSRFVPDAGSIDCVFLCYANFQAIFDNSAPDILSVLRRLSRFIPPEINTFYALWLTLSQGLRAPPLA